MQNSIALCAVCMLLLVSTVRTEEQCTKDYPGDCGDSRLPDWCYKPEGADCSFYEECLEKRFPCKKYGKSYAIDCGLKFCSLFQGAYKKFSEDGKRWVDAVKKCLQVKLVPFLGPDKNPTCKEILTEAFEMHPGCYTEPAPGAPSICDLGWKDRMRLLWTVKSSLMDVSIMKLTLKQMVAVAEACYGHSEGDLLEDMLIDA